MALEAGGEMKNVKSRFLHSNLNVFDLDRSLAFYEKALGLKEVRHKKKRPASPACPRPAGPGAVAAE